MKSFSLPLLLLLAHGLTQLGMSVTELMSWHWALLGLHLGADFGLFLWVLGPEKRAAIWQWPLGLLRTERTRYRSQSG